MPECYWLAEMTWPEFQTALPQLEWGLIPLGATEQHGPTGTFAMDTARAEGFTRLLAERLYPHAVAVPCFAYSFSRPHMDFPGTLSLSAGTMIRVLEQVALSLHRHGLKKLFFVSAHEGQTPALNIVLASLKERAPDLRVGWSNMSALAADLRDATVGHATGHADEAELSEALYLAPGSVRTPLARSVAAGTRAVLNPGAPATAPKAVRVAQRLDSRSVDGAYGDQQRARPEWGREFVTTALDRLEAYLRAHF